MYSVVLEKVVLSKWCFVLWWTGSEEMWKRPVGCIKELAATSLSLHRERGEEGRRERGIT